MILSYFGVNNNLIHMSYGSFLVLGGQLDTGSYPSVVYEWLWSPILVQLSHFLMTILCWRFSCLICWTMNYSRSHHYQTKAHTKLQKIHFDNLNVGMNEEWWLSMWQWSNNIYRSWHQIWGWRQLGRQETSISDPGIWAEWWSEIFRTFRNDESKDLLTLFTLNGCQFCTPAVFSFFEAWLSLWIWGCRGK